MSTRAIQCLAALIFLAIGVYVLVAANRLQLYTSLGPGPGFMPGLVGVVLVASSLALLISEARRPDTTWTFLSGPVLREILATLAAIAAYAVLIERIGFVLTVSAVLSFLIWLHGTSPVKSLLIGVVASFVIGIAFANLLGVVLPATPGQILQSIRL